MQAAMAQMSVQSASGGIELFSIGPHTKPGALPHLRKPKTLNLSVLEMNHKCCISLLASRGPFFGDIIPTFVWSLSTFWGG